MRRKTNRLTDGVDTREFAYIAVVGIALIILVFGNHLVIRGIAHVGARLF